MTDDRMMPGYAGHCHARVVMPTPVMELDGVPVALSVDPTDGNRGAVLWTCGLRGGECVSRPLDLDAAGPDDDWYIENGYWDNRDADGPGTPERIIVSPDQIAARVTVTHLDGRPAVVTGGDLFDLHFEGEEDPSGGIVRAWDLRTGRRIGKVMIGHVVAVCELTTVPYERRLLCVSGDETGKLLAWDLASGERVAEIQGCYGGAMGAAVVDGRPVAATGGEDALIQVWDLLTGEQIGKPLTGIEPMAGAIAITKVDDRAVVVAGGDDTMLHVWDLASQEPLGPPVTGHRILTLGTTTVAGRTIAVTGSYDGDLGDGTTRVWDLTRGEQIGDPITGHHLQMVTEVAGTPVAVTEDSDHVIRLWDLTLAAAR